MEVHDGFFAAIAELLAYPDGDFRQRLARCRAMLSRGEGKGQSPFVRSTLQAVPANEDCPFFPERVVSHLTDFDTATCGYDLTDLEELYARTFDFTPSCALEIGWHLFGEDYNRGALLVRLREELARHGVQESCELPDHLAHVLPLLDRMKPDEAARFAPACVTPAVKKILAGFEGKQNPYEYVFRGLIAMLDIEFGDGEYDGMPAQEKTPSSRYDSQESAHESTDI